MKIRKSELKKIILEVLEDKLDYEEIDEGGEGSGRKKLGGHTKEQLRNMDRAIRTGKYDDGTKIDKNTIERLKKIVAPYIDKIKK